MSWNLIDRRRERSTDRATALRYQLEHVRMRGQIEALVVADDEGLLLAASGDPSVCEELGAIAPLVAQSPFGMRMPPLLRGGEVALRPVTAYGQQLWVACLGGGMARDAHLTNAERGVGRILSAN